MKEKRITNEYLEQYEEKVSNDRKYGTENEIIKEAFEKFKYNDDKAIIAMKVSLIDLTNSTNLWRNLGKKDGLDKLVNKIMEIDFDKRVEEGDKKLVEELSEWTKKHIGKNLFSFISKYCFYHNEYSYHKDNYMIYDSIICKNIHKYITKKEYQELTGKKMYKNSLKKLKETFNYEEYMKVIDFIIEKNNISVDRPHRKLDWYIWYSNRLKK